MSKHSIFKLLGDFFLVSLLKTGFPWSIPMMQWGSNAQVWHVLDVKPSHWSQVNRREAFLFAHPCPHHTHLFCWWERDCRKEMEVHQSWRNINLALMDGQRCTLPVRDQPFVLMTQPPAHSVSRHALWVQVFLYPSTICRWVCRAMREEKGERDREKES